MNLVKVALLSCIAACPRSGVVEARTTSRGNIPTGLWVLDRARSSPAAVYGESLWVVEDDGRVMSWVSVRIEPRNSVSITTWQGRYGRPASPSARGEMMLSLTSARSGAVKLAGFGDQVGAIDESCVVAPSGKRMRCTIGIGDGAARTTVVKRFRFHPLPPD